MLWIFCVIRSYWSISRENEIGSKINLKKAEILFVRACNKETTKIGLFFLQTHEQQITHSFIRLLKATKTWELILLCNQLTRSRANEAEQIQFFLKVKYSIIVDKKSFSWSMNNTNAKQIRLHLEPLCKASIGRLPTTNSHDYSDMNRESRSRSTTCCQQMHWLQIKIQTASLHFKFKFRLPSDMKQNRMEESWMLWYVHVGRVMHSFAADWHRRKKFCVNLIEIGNLTWFF